jgi:ornithine decarboxylase
MKGRSGVVLWDDTIRLGIEWRKKVRAIRREFEEKEGDPLRRWFFDPFVPDTVKGPDGKVAWESLSTDELASNAKYWELTPGADWHGFTHVAADYAMTDPNKLTVLTPGFNRHTGEYADHGVPAPIVAQYLRENRIVPEKNDLNSLLFLLTPGVESSKAGPLISGLVAFKRLHDDNVPLEEAMPEFVRRRPNRYKGVRLRDLCADFHAFHREAGTSTLQRKQFEPGHLPEMVMTPKEAVQQLTRNNVDYVPIAEAEGRVATTLLLVYPPGIGTVLPGERLDERAKPMLDYFKMFERSANLFPGFEAEIQGVFRDVDPDGTIRFHTYVMRETR